MEPARPRTEGSTDTHHFRSAGATDRVFFSVCIPTFNRAVPLGERLEQFERILRRSAYRDVVEMVVSDNGSDDGTDEVIRSWFDRLAAHCELRTFRQKRNIGGEAHFDFMYGQARGEYVWLCSDDDTVVEEDFDRLLSDLQRFGPEICISSFENFGTSGGPVEIEAGAETQLVTDLGAAVARIHKLANLTQYVYRGRRLTEEERALTTEAAQTTSFGFLTLTVMLLARHEARLLLRASTLARSDKRSWNMRFSPRVYATKRDAILLALRGHPLHARFAKEIPLAPVENFVVGNLFRTSIGLSKIEHEVAVDEFRHMKENLGRMAFSSWRNLVKIPFVLALFPVVSRIRNRRESRKQ